MSPPQKRRIHLIIIVITLNLLSKLATTEHQCRMHVPDPIVFSRDGDVTLAYIGQFTATRESDGMYCAAPRSNIAAIQYPELFKYAVGKVNADDTLLPNVTLGVTLLDGCMEAQVNLARVWTLLLGSCHGIEPERAESGSGVGSGSVAKNLIGVLGPITSSQSVTMSGSLGLHHIPHIGIVATSDDLSDKTRYEYYSRMVPPDRYQTEMMMDMVAAFGWTYFSLFYDEGSYGENAAKQIIRKASQREDVCIGDYMMKSSYHTKQDIEEALLNIYANPNNRVLVVFMFSSSFNILVASIWDLGLQGHFVILSGDAACGETGLKTPPVGMLCISFHILSMPEFTEHYKTLDPHGEETTPWTLMAWEQFLDCSWAEEATNSTVNLKRSCHGLSILDANPADLEVHMTSSYRISDGVFVFAHALHMLIEDKCPEVFLGEGKAEECILREELLGYIRNVKFRGFSGNIEFDKSGDMISGYALVQLVLNEHGHEEVVNVGNWHFSKGAGKRLELYAGAVDFSMFQNDTQRNNTTNSENSANSVDSENPDNLFSTENPVHLTATSKSETPNDFIPISVCSLPCEPRQYYHYEENMCCWKCRTCRSNEYIAENLRECLQCPEYTWPDEDNALRCEDIPITTLGASHPIGIAILVTGVLGFITAVIIMVIMTVKRKSKLVKACSRELSAVSLIGTLLASCTAFLFVLYPTEALCVTRRILFHLSVSIIFTPILAKTSRVYRIFSSARKTQARPRFISPRAQMVITGLLLGVQCVLLALTSLLSTPSAVLHMPVPTMAYVERHCTQDVWAFLVPLAFNILLLLICFAFGFLTRKLPENFNESWFIFLSVAATLLMWALMLPTYFTAFYAYARAAILAFCLLVNVFLTLACQYGTKMYALLWVREENIVLGTMVNTTQVSAVSN